MRHFCRAFLVACLLIGGLISSGPPVHGEAKKDEKKEPVKALLSQIDQLTDKDEKDTRPSLKRSPRKVFKIMLTEGKIYQIDLKSGDFDSVLRLENAAGKEVAFNDDFMPGSDDARIFYAAGVTAEFRIIATCLDGKTGKFALTVVEAPPGTTVSAFKGTQIELKAKDGKAGYSGELNTKDPLAKGKYYKVFTIQLDAGTTYRIDLRSDEFDAFLYLEDPTGNTLEENDDFADSMNSRIVYKAASTGSYRLIATTYPAKQTGKFTLDVVTEPGKKKEKAKQQSRRLERGEPFFVLVQRRAAHEVSGPLPSCAAPSLTNSSSAAGDPLLKKSDVLKKDDEKDTRADLKNSPRKVYPITLEAGKAYQIDLKSKDFDTVLRLEDAKGKEVASNDDADISTLDSRIIYKPAKTGDFKIIVTTFDGIKVGNFTLTVVEADPKAAATTASKYQGKPIELKWKDGKAAFAGKLAETDSTVYKHYFKLFQIELEKGKLYRIDYRDPSDTKKLDPYLILEDPDGNKLDFDDGDGVKAFLKFRAAQTGAFRIIATTSPQLQTGRFTLEIGPAADAKDPKKDKK